MIGETKTAVKAIKYHHAPGWVRVLSNKVNFSGNSYFIEQRASLFICKGISKISIGLSIQGSAPTNHTCTMAKKPHDPEMYYYDTDPRDVNLLRSVF